MAVRQWVTSHATIVMVGGTTIHDLAASTSWLNTPSLRRQ